MTEVLDADGCTLDLGVAREIGADEPPVPSPLILGVTRRMDAGEPAARPDVAFKCSLLAVVEDVTGGAQEYDHLVPSELRIGEARGVLRAVDRETMVGPERLDGGDAVRNRVVAKAGRLAENEDRELGLRALRLGDAARRPAEHAEDDQQ